MERMRMEMDSILDAILNSEFFTEELKQQPIEQRRKESIQEHGYPNPYYAYYHEILDSFFNQDVEDIAKVEPVLAYLSKELRSDLDDLWENSGKLRKEVVAKLDLWDCLHGERKVSDVLKELEEQVSSLYEELLDAEWKGLTVEEATEKLKEKGIYVALLGEDHKLTREPFPAMFKEGVNVTAEIKTEVYGFSHSRWLHINFNPQQESKLLNGETMKISGHAHRVRPNEKDFAIIQK
jgi:hypothetical protein